MSQLRLQLLPGIVQTGVDCPLTEVKDFSNLGHIQLMHIAQDDGCTMLFIECIYSQPDASVDFTLDRSLFWRWRLILKASGELPER